MYTKLAAALAAMLMLSGIACASAFAEYEGGQWYLNGTTLVETITVKSQSTTNLKLEDTKAGLAVECKTKGERKVGPEGKGEVTAVTASECKTVKACETGTITVKAVHLPWKTQLETPENTTDRETISSGGTGAPGWDMECKVLGIKINDECTGETSEKVESKSGGVDTVFDSHSATLSCTVGGSGAGVVTGTSLDENPLGKELQDRFIPIAASNNSGAGEAERAGTIHCLFTAGNQRCLVIYKNMEAAGVTANISLLQRDGPEFASRYTLEAVPAECETGRNSMLNGGEACAAAIKTVATIAPNWVNGYFVWVRKGNLTGRGVIVLET